MDGYPLDAGSRFEKGCRRLQVAFVTRRPKSKADAARH
jgi:hypothetical protein